MKKKLIAFFLTCIIALIFLNFYITLNRENIKLTEKTNKMIALQKLTDVTDKLQAQMNKSFEYTQFLDLMLRINNEKVTDEFDTYASMILERNPTINSVQLAPQGVIEHVYPLQGNEEAVGHNLLTDPKRSTFVREAIDKKVSISQGPVSTRQGKMLIFNRKAIFIEDKFWGLAIVAIDFDNLLKECGISEDNQFFLYSICAEKVDGDKDHVWGDQDLFLLDSVQKKIDMSGQSWKVAIYPKEGWANSLSSPTVYDVFTLITILVVTILTFFHIYNYLNKSEKAKQDSLTETLNAASFKRYVKIGLVKKNKKHAFIIIDLNEFKKVNDLYGHPIGDAVIIETANRLKQIIGNKGLLSRIGGDEYAIFFKNIKQEESIDKIVQQILDITKVPIKFNEVLLNIDISLGYALFPKDATTYDELYYIADNQMYQNKKECKYSKK